MKVLFPVILVSLAIVSAITACVPQTEVIKLYDDTERMDRTYERILVVSIAGDTGSRRRLEELITANLTSARVSAVAGYTQTGLKIQLLQEEARAIVRQLQIDRFVG